MDNVLRDVAWCFEFKLKILSFEKPVVLFTIKNKTSLSLGAEDDFHKLPKKGEVNIFPNKVQFNKVFDYIDSFTSLLILPIKVDFTLEPCICRKEEYPQSLMLIDVWE